MTSSTTTTTAATTDGDGGAVPATSLRRVRDRVKTLSSSRHLPRGKKRARARGGRTGSRALRALGPRGWSSLSALTRRVTPNLPLGAKPADPAAACAPRKSHSPRQRRRAERVLAAESRASIGATSRPARLHRRRYRHPPARRFSRRTSIDPGYQPAPTLRALPLVSLRSTPDLG